MEYEFITSFATVSGIRYVTKIVPSHSINPTHYIAFSSYSDKQVLVIPNANNYDNNFLESVIENLTATDDSPAIVTSTTRPRTGTCVEGIVTFALSISGNESTNYYLCSHDFTTHSGTYRKIGVDSLLSSGDMFVEYFNNFLVFIHAYASREDGAKAWRFFSPNGLMVMQNTCVVNSKFIVATGTDFAATSSETRTWISEFAYSVDSGDPNANLLEKDRVFVNGDIENGSVRIDSNAIPGEDSILIASDAEVVDDVSGKGSDKLIGIGNTNMNRIRLGVLEFLNSDEKLVIRLKDEPTKAIEWYWPLAPVSEEFVE
jgi:hypothetical protein